VKGPAGTTVTIKYSERVRKDSGLLDQKIFCYPGLQFSAIAPQYSIHVFDAAFGGIYPVLVWYLHQYYGDDQILAEHYAGMKKWVDYVTSLAPGHILSQGTYGDHMEPGESPGQEGFISKESPPPLIWTAYYYLDVSVIAKVANLLGKKEDARHYATLADEIKEAFNQKWFNPKLSRYATGTQTCNLIPLAIGLVPEAHQSSVVNNVVTDIVEKHRGRFHAGDIGAVCMVDMLPEHGQGDLLYKIATATTCPGWGYMVQQGATTIWESWGRSWPHSDRERHESMIMLSFIEKFFYEDLAGLRGPAFHATRSMPPGYRQVVIQPRVLGDLSRASASIKTVRGTVSSSWQRSGNAIRRDVAIPVNSEAKVSMPKLGLNNVRVEEGADKAATDLQKAVGK
jgi:alpha-L-rhamnosidase